MGVVQEKQGFTVQHEPELFVSVSGSAPPLEHVDVVARLSFDGIAEIVFEFTPDLADVERRASRARDGQWMIRMSDGHLFPEGCRFPSLSKA
ncbi:MULTISPECIES: hypothetical protein [Exiguobacterium]|uniref:hypothetical protein n=1 Tax=Exiguobacterium TaxID=33986 RepID=UPI00087754E9|nr:MULTISPECIES: hypothetical protein [Exiguobacterium]TCI26301.1 hypothetical protein EVJ32_06475 [Exiguobacterium sp. SH5S4]TCI64155.1 hypothetical protein EVJ26_04675 [Exiguobacterium sp. SH3S1]